MRSEDGHQLAFDTENLLVTSWMYFKLWEDMKGEEQKADEKGSGRVSC
jgi:hypothetical protein